MRVLRILERYGRFCKEFVNSYVFLVFFIDGKNIFFVYLLIMIFEISVDKFVIIKI